MDGHRLDFDPRRELPRGRSGNSLDVTLDVYAGARGFPYHLFMTHRSIAAAAAICLLTMVPAQPRAQNTSDEAKRIGDAATIFGEIMSADDKAIPEAILSKATGIAIFPSTISAGLVVGGIRGRGVISARGKDGWSSPAFLTLTGGSFGLQIGGQATDIILVINGDRGLQNLVSNQFKVGAGASVAAGPVGRDAQAATDIQLRAEILSYSRSRGLFAGVTINGSTIRQDQDANQRFYGKRLTTKQILFDGLAGAPEPVAAWKAALDKYAK
jgi:lipid-binding SYLF domain-containing protein